MACPNKKVFVVWPPVWHSSTVHVAVPALAGYLSRQGIDVSAFDLNIEFFRHAIREETFRELRAQLPAESPPAARDLAFAERYFQIRNSPVPSGVSARFSEDAEEVLLHAALRLTSAVHVPTQITPDGIYPGGDMENSDSIAAFADSDRENPFVSFFRRDFLPVLQSERPGILGISVSGHFQIPAAFTLARLARECLSDLFIVIGGAHFSLIPEVFLQAKTAANLFRHVDAFLFNEGEIPFLRLIRALLDGRSADGIPNVLLKGQGRWSQDPALHLPPGEIARPLFDDAVLDKYFFKQRSLPVEASRGCYWSRCAFCNLTCGANRRYRPVPTDRIEEEMLRCRDGFGASHIVLSTLSMAPPVMRRLAVRLVGRNDDLRWICWMRPDENLVPDDFELFRRSGCNGLFMTPESFCERTLERMCKGFERRRLIDTISRVLDAGLCADINLIAGFPGETLEEFLSSLEVCRALRLRGEFYIFHLLVHSPMHRDPGRFGLRLLEQPDKDCAVLAGFNRTDGSPHPTGIDMVRAAAAIYPHNIRASDPLCGFTFDFS